MQKNFKSPNPNPNPKDLHVKTRWKKLLLVVA